MEIQALQDKEECFLNKELLANSEVVQLFLVVLFLLMRLVVTEFPCRLSRGLRGFLER